MCLSDKEKQLVLSINSDFVALSYRKQLMTHIYSMFPNQHEILNYARSGKQKIHQFFISSFLFDEKCEKKKTNKQLQFAFAINQSINHLFTHVNA